MPDNDEEQQPTGTNDGEQAEVQPSSRRNALGIGAVITGALLLFPIALVLGYLGLRAAKRGTATNKRVALAGVILGYIGLIVALVGTALALFVVWPDADARTTDNAAKADVITLGNELGAATASGQQVSDWNPSVAWVAGEAADTMQLADEPVFGVTGQTEFDWCLALAYEGGNQTQASFSATEGLMEDGATCGAEVYAGAN